MSWATVSARGAARWAGGHPWIYRSDVVSRPEAAGIVPVRDSRGKFLGQALCSPRSEIRLRLLERSDVLIDDAWWRGRFERCRDRRRGIDANAWRAVHAEGDGLPALIVDRYDRWLVVQMLSAALETATRRRSSTPCATHSWPTGSCCATTLRPVASKDSTSRSSSHPAPCRSRSRCARDWCAGLPRPGPARRPAPSSTSATIACSPAAGSRRAAPRSTASPIMGRSRCTSPRGQARSPRSMSARKRSRAAR